MIDDLLDCEWYEMVSASETHIEYIPLKFSWKKKKNVAHLKYNGHTTVNYGPGGVHRTYHRLKIKVPPGP